MSKLKKLSEKFERYDITIDPTTTKDPVNPFGAKATITVLNDTNAIIKRVVGQCYGAVNVAEAEKEALDKAISRILGNKETSQLVDKHPSFDIAVDATTTNNVTFPIGIKVVVGTYDDKNKIIRKAHGIAMGTDILVVEAAAIKSAVKKVLGE